MKKVLLTVLTTALVLCSVLFIGAACSDGTENGNNEIYSVYQTYVAYAEANGTTPLTYEEWLKTIKGENGKDGLNGKDGADGQTPFIGENGNWWIGYTDTGIPAKGQNGADGKDGSDGKDGLNGKDGTDGKNGENGLSAYELYKKYHPEYTKSEEEFLDDLVNGRLGNKESENPLELDFYSQPDGTYWVSLEKAKYLTELVVPSTYKGKPVTGICGKYDQINLEKITIPGSIKTVESYLGDNLTEIHIGSLESWCKIKGINCLTNGNMPDKKLYLNETEITNLVIPAEISTIDDRTFARFTSLQSVVIPEGVTSIGIEAFAGCTGLQNITIPEGVTSIGVEAFAGCTGLQSVTIPECVTSIGGGAFDGCESLLNVSIPDSIIEIGSAFDECEKIKYNEYDNAKYLGNESNPYVVLMSAKDKNITSCVINEKTKIIYESAFSACEKLTSIIIPEGVRSIGFGAFIDCSELTNVSIPDSIESAVFAFTGCRKLQYNEYGNAKYLGNENNPYLVLVKGINQEITSCEVNEKTKIINSGAFGGGNLETLTVSENVKYIGSEIFWSNRHGVNITYTGTKEQWKTIVKSSTWWHTSAGGAVHCTDGDLSKYE